MCFTSFDFVNIIHACAYYLNYIKTGRSNLFTSPFKVIEIYLSKLSIPVVWEYYLVRGMEKYSLVDFPIYLNNSTLSLLLYPNLTRLLTFIVLTSISSLSLTIIIKQYTNHEKILKLFWTVNKIIIEPKTIRTYQIDEVTTS